MIEVDWTDILEQMDERPELSKAEFIARYVMDLLHEGTSFDEWDIEMAWIDYADDDDKESHWIHDTKEVRDE